jgi:DNA adenine methylase
VSKNKSAASTEGAQSFLRWAGSKRKILSEIAKEYTDRNATYVEPFAGSAVLFFRLAPQKAFLSDLNGQLISSLRAVRGDPARVATRLERMPRTEEKYYRTREDFNRATANSFTRAVQFIYLNRNCFNGLWRTDTQGRFNVPFGGDKTGRNPSEEIFATCSKALQSASLKHCDFRLALDRAAAKGNFIYLDPPYFAAEERVFVEYGKRTFGAKDLDDLLNALPRLDRAGARFVLSYRFDKSVIKRCSRWNVKVLQVMRNVGGFSASRRTHREILITNK